MSKYAKAIGAAVVTLLMFVFVGDGTTIEAHEAVLTLAEAFAVWVIPNRGA